MANPSDATTIGSAAGCTFSLATPTINVLNGSGTFVPISGSFVLNAANCQWIDDLHAALDELEAAERLRVVIISGRGRAFSTGIDLKALSNGEIQIGWFRLWEEAMRRIEKLQAVTIARVNGYALGGGLQVCLACDLRVASEDAQFGLPAVLEALIPGTGTYRLPRFVGLGRARRMILTGETVGALEALEIGLADWVVPAAQLVEQCRHHQDVLHVDGVGAAAAVAAQADIDLGVEEGAHRQQARADAQIADRVVRYAASMLGRERDLVGPQPDAMGDGGARREQADFSEVADHRAAMLTIHGTRLRRQRLGFVDMTEDRQLQTLGKIGDAL